MCLRAGWSRKKKRERSGRTKGIKNTMKKKGVKPEEKNLVDGKKTNK